MERARMSQTPYCPDKREKVDLEMMALGTIKLEEVGKDKDLVTYERVWEDLALDHSIDMTHSFWVGLLLEAIITRQDKVVELLGTM